MTYNKTPEKALDLQGQHHSDGSELIPAEVQANMQRDDNIPLVKGSTVDDEGLLNNYAIEPEVYPSSYPSREQQRRYIVLGAGAALFVVSLVLVSFFVS